MEIFCMRGTAGGDMGAKIMSFLGVGQSGARGTNQALGTQTLTQHVVGAGVKKKKRGQADINNPAMSEMIHNFILEVLFYQVSSKTDRKRRQDTEL